LVGGPGGTPFFLGAGGKGGGEANGFTVFPAPRAQGGVFRKLAGGGGKPMGIFVFPNGIFFLGSGPGGAGRGGGAAGNRLGVEKTRVFFRWGGFSFAGICRERGDRPLNRKKKIGGGGLGGGKGKWGGPGVGGGADHD